MFSVRYKSDVCKHKKTILSYRMGPKKLACVSFLNCAYVLFSLLTYGLMLLCFVDTILKTIIFQGSVATSFRCCEICHKSSLKIVRSA